MYYLLCTALLSMRGFSLFSTVTRQARVACEALPVTLPGARQQKGGWDASRECLNTTPVGTPVLAGATSGGLSGHEHTVQVLHFTTTPCQLCYFTPGLWGGTLKSLAVPCKGLQGGCQCQFAFHP
jgi:hypothetical protein